MTRLVLASASPARLATLTRAGISPAVLVSGVDEDAALARARDSAGDLDPAHSALVLAKAKCEAVAATLEAGEAPADIPDDALVLGCDSVLELDGQIMGKPGNPDTAIRRWQQMRGRSGILHSGHWIIDLRENGTGATTGTVVSTTVHFADLTDAEIEAYVATGEPLWVAGGFTIDGIGGAYITGIEGDHHNVIGVSLPTLRTMLAELDISWHDLRESPDDA